jgi:hypothetical protein
MESVTDNFRYTFCLILFSSFFFLLVFILDDSVSATNFHTNGTGSYKIP